MAHILLIEDDPRIRSIVERGLIHVRQAKGKKDRFVMLSDRLLGHPPGVLARGAPGNAIPVPWTEDGKLP